MSCLFRVDSGNLLNLDFWKTCEFVERYQNCTTLHWFHPESHCPTMNPSIGKPFMFPVYLMYLWLGRDVIYTTVKRC